MEAKKKIIYTHVLKFTPRHNYYLWVEDEKLNENYHPLTIKSNKSTGYEVLFVTGLNSNKILQQTWFKDYKSAKNQTIKLFSQVNNCLPFKVTGQGEFSMTEGHYPSVSEAIKNMKQIDLTLPTEVPTFSIIYEIEGDRLYKRLIYPI